jgi:hypothetical protein
MVTGHKRSLSLSPYTIPRSSKQILTYISYISASLLALFVSYHTLLYLFNESFVWQCTTLADIIEPVNRKACDIKNYKSSLSKTSNFHRALDTLPKDLKIGMLMLYNDKDGTWNNELMARVLKNREEYSRMHGYSIVVANDALDSTRPPAWSKLKALDLRLDAFDYLLYIDMDVVIMNMNIKLESFIALDPNKDVIMTEDWNGPNTGVWLVKRTEWSHWFLQASWNQTQLIPRHSKDGVPHPFEYEQRAVHYLLDTDIWRSRKLPRYHANIEEIRSHFLFLPQCAMNSYILYPYYPVGDRETAHYIDGDFLVHFAGKKGDYKTGLMEHFLTVAERGK